VRWAIVIGIDEYGAPQLQLQAAVADAERFRAWVVSEDGGRVPEDNVHLLLGRRPGEHKKQENEVAPTKANIVQAINDVVAAAEARGRGDRLYFFFSGHGITAQLAGREESALVLPGFDERHPEHSLAVRSLAEHLETTPFDDQFFFVDACRTLFEDLYGQIGAWPIPRRRDPGQSPVQQFILYATSPGLTAAQSPWPEDGEFVSAFTEVLISGLEGGQRAKAWSWERSSYEVRWERLATYVNKAMSERKQFAKGAGAPPPGGWPIQIPQDAGSRGVADRDRDAVLATYRRGHFPDVELELKLVADSAVDEAEVTVLDAIGVPVVRAQRVPGSPVTFALPPGTYAARATRETLVGNVKAPLEVYDRLTDEITLREAPDGPSAEEQGTIAVHSHDPLSTAEILDEAGGVVAVLRNGEEHPGNAGFYRVRHLRPERAVSEADGPVAVTEVGEGEGEGDEDRPAEQRFIVLERGDHRHVNLGAPPPADDVVRLAEALGGGTHDDFVIPYAGAEPMAWAHPSTVLAVAVGAALDGDVSLAALGVPDPRTGTEHKAAAIAVYVVARDDVDDAALGEGLALRAWPLGTTTPATDERVSLPLSAQRVAGAVVALDQAGPHWLALERGDEATVLTLPVLPGRLATVVAQIEPAWMRLYQFHPALAPSVVPAANARRLRRLEHLERLLLGGALDGARPLAEELADVAHEDPFAGLLAGYVLLRLGLHEPLAAIASAVIQAVPTLADAHVLRGEHEAAEGRLEARNQAFADAVNAGIPMFGEGLTRLVEGLRASAFHHPRGTLVRHIFRRHVRGTMWSAFRPTRALTPGELVISGSDLGYEG
jgi:hypothetical protein